MAYNKVVLMGNMVENPELKYTGNNIPVTSFRLAVARRFKSEDAETDFFSVVAWRSTAEFICKHFPRVSLYWYQEAFSPVHGRTTRATSEVLSRLWLTRFPSAEASRKVQRVRLLQ